MHFLVSRTGALRHLIMRSSVQTHIIGELSFRERGICGVGQVGSMFQKWRYFHQTCCDYSTSVILREGERPSRRTPAMVMPVRSSGFWRVISLASLISLQNLRSAPLADRFVGVLRLRRSPSL